MDHAERLTRARAARWEQLLDQVDPNRILDEDERERRAREAQRAHLKAASLKGGQVLREQAKRRRVGKLLAELLELLAEPA